MQSLTSRTDADTSAVAATASGLKGMVGLAAVLSLALGLTGGLAVSAPGSRSNGGTPGIRGAGRHVLVGPEGDPLNMPSDVAVGREGHLYVLDGVHHRAVVYDAEGQFRFQFGTHGSGPGQFRFPLGIAAAADGRIYVADSGNHRVQVFAADGTHLEVIELPDAETDASPDPTDMVFDRARQRLYIADNDSHHILVYSLAQSRFEAVWGRPGQGQRQFRYPFLLDLSADGYLLVVESINTRVQVLNPAGKFVCFIGGWGVKPGQLFRPKGAACHENRVFVTDSYLGRVQVFDLTGRFLGTLADATGAAMKFTTPTGVAVDAERRRLYVVELKANQVCRVDLE